MLLIDSHSHLQDEAFSDDVTDVIRRAESAGVGLLVCNGTREADWQQVAELAFEHHQVLPCFGLHPWFVSDRSPNWLAELERMLDVFPSGIGEIGLDLWFEPRDEAVQEQVFRAQLGVARRRKRPVMIHCLRAWDWLMTVLRDEAPLPAGMLIHAYGGPVRLIEELAAMGAYFSFAGNAFEPRRSLSRQSLAAVPLDRLMIETDAPDLLPPESLRRFALQRTDGTLRNEPGNLPLIFSAVARLRSLPEAQLEEQLRANARRFFAPVRAME